MKKTIQQRAENALKKGNVLRISYTSKRAETTEREVEPIGVIYYARYWHLIGFCRIRNDYRDFRLDKIEKLVTTRKKIKIPIY